MGEQAGDNSEMVIEPDIARALGPDPHRLLGIKQSATRLEVVQAFQRVLRAAGDDEQRAAISDAFKRTGVRSIRTRCPYGHELTIYDLASETHSAYCAYCNEAASEYVHHRYVSGATALEASKQPAEMDESRLPYGTLPSPLETWKVSYRTRNTMVPPEVIEFTCDARMRVKLDEADRFSVIWLDKTPWLLLNHTCATTYKLDPYLRHREAMNASREAERLRRKQFEARHR